jgi:hypothetical protein
MRVDKRVRREVRDAPEPFVLPKHLRPAPALIPSGVPTPGR